MHVSSYNQSFMDYLNTLRFSESSELREAILQMNPEATNDVRMKLVMYVGLEKQLFLDGDLIRAKDVSEKAKNLAEMHPDTIQGDYLAFMYYVQGLFFRLQHDLIASKSYFQRAKQHCVAENLKQFINYQLDAFHATEDFQKISALKKRVEQFRERNIHFMYILGLLRIGRVYRLNKVFDTAEEYNLDALRLAKKHSLQFLVDKAQNNLGHVYYRKREYDKAHDILKPLAEMTENNLCRILALGNIYGVYKKQKRYDDALSTLYQVLNVATAHNVISRLPAIYRAIGQMYDEHFHQPEQALHYHRLGYEEAVRQLDNGLGFNGPRKTAVIRYVEFSQKLNYRKLDKTVEKKPFEFALGKTWKEIKNIFQYHLLSYHKDQSTGSQKFLAVKIFTQVISFVSQPEW